MKTKKAILIILFSLGIIFLNCNKSSLDSDCGTGPYPGHYFDIQGIQLVNWKAKEEGCCKDQIEENEEVDFDKYQGMFVLYEVEYHASIESKKNWNFDLFSPLYACTPLEPGDEGSQTEKLSSFNVITLNDFDSLHLANDTINDLFQIKLHRSDLIDLEEYLAQDTSLITEKYLELDLKKAPESGNEFQVKVIVNLSTDETYEVESVPFKLNN